MKILVACEFSQIVTKAFRERGHEAYSCDLLPTEGNPDWHIQGDVLEILDDGWDMMIAHPPCTYLCVPGAHYLHTCPGRLKKMWDARIFFLRLWDAKMKSVCIENPLPHKYAVLPKYTQIIQPWMFGHELSKRTCLWLKELPALKPTDIRENHGERYIRSDRQQKDGYGKLSNSKWYARSSAKERSRTFGGIAKAMAEQWG